MNAAKFLEDVIPMSGTQMRILIFARLRWGS